VLLLIGNRSRKILIEICVSCVWREEHQDGGDARYLCPSCLYFLGESEAGKSVVNGEVNVGYRTPAFILT